MGNQLVSVSETAKSLGVSRDTVRRLIDRKELRAVRVARRLMVPQTEIERACVHGVGATDSHPTAAKN
jgi:excisionase family DNA binding protein